MRTKLATYSVLIAVGLGLFLLGLGGCNPGGYETCRAAIKASAAPLHRGDPGWNQDLDGDGDGVACENGRTTP